MWWGGRCGIPPFRKERERMGHPQFGELKKKLGTVSHSPGKNSSSLSLLLLLTSRQLDLISCSVSDLQKINICFQALEIFPFVDPLAQYDLHKRRIHIQSTLQVGQRLPPVYGRRVRLFTRSPQLLTI